MYKHLFAAAIFGTLLIGSATLVPLPAAAKAKSPAVAAATPAAAEKVTKFPFHGKLSAVDVAGKTFTLEGKTPRVFNITDQTKITKNGESAALKDAKVGEDVGGYTEKASDGKLTALSVRFGPKPEKAGAATAPAEGGTAAPAAATPAAKSKHTKKTETHTPAGPAEPPTTPGQ